jgi:hypothetical protein
MQLLQDLHEGNGEAEVSFINERDKKTKKGEPSWITRVVHRTDKWTNAKGSCYGRAYAWFMT